MPRPSFFLVGAPKCGTTSLCHYLNQHPDIFIPEREELHFFGSDLELPRPFKTEDGYLGAFTAIPKPLAGERTTWYLYSTTAAREIYSFHGDSKIIVSVRNPIDMVHSLFRYRRFIGVERSDSFVHVLDREKQYLACNGAGITPHHVYTGAALYFEQVKRYVEIFGSGNVHVVVFDDIKDDPEQVYRGLLQFLGVRDDFRPAFRHVHRTGRIRNERFQQRIAHLPPPFKRLAYAFPRIIRRPAYRALHRLNTSYAPPPPLHPDLRRRLNDQFLSDVERLSALLGRDLTHWVAT